MRTDTPALAMDIHKRIVIIVPIGSCEQHGPHLPIDTDLRIAQLLADNLHEKMSENAILLPAIPFSCAWEHKGLGTIALQVETVARILHDIAKSIITWNISAVLVLVNWHGGNDLLGAVATEISASEGLPTVVIPALSQVGKAWDDSNMTKGKEIHAGAIESSIVMAYWPRLVTGTITNEDDHQPNIAPTKAQAVMQALGIKSMAPMGIWGVPSDLDIKKGKLLITRLSEQMYEQTQRLLEIVASLEEQE